ncbi:hypothetical protein N9L47_03075 [Rhodobacteraceae bacterium]|nr:hypothetical protein [Paracoccaceae bacterium]
MSDTDSFVSEVSEEVRKDKLYKLMRRFGWIPITLIVLVVGGASFVEWQKAQARSAAEATGDALISALAENTPEARATAFESYTPDGSPEQRAVVALLRAAAETEAGEEAKARDTLDGVAASADTPAIYRDLAILKSVMLPGSAPEARIEQLAPLMVAGNPYRLLAIEQRAFAEIELGETETAIQTLEGIVADAGRTEALRRRAGQLIVALGGTLSES